MELLLVRAAEYLNGYQIQLTFNTGEIKVVDLSNHLNKPIFRPLKNRSFFKNFKMNPFTIEWANGADFSPEYLYRLAEEQDLALLIRETN